METTLICFIAYWVWEWRESGISILTQVSTNIVIKETLYKMVSYLPN